MRRLHSIERYQKIIDKIRSSERDISLTTDIIVGFPGETEADFEETIKLVEYCKFDSAYIFKYSPRPGTPAYEMFDSVTPAEKTRRFREVERIQKEIQTANLQRYIGRSLSVLAEKRSAKSTDDLSGHSTCHRVVNFRGDTKFLGSVVDVTITEVKSNSLYGKGVTAA
jgi:tRNA-2-methylthio-N6-dimethylallyladenosine synthase